MFKTGSPVSNITGGKIDFLLLKTEKVNSHLFHKKNSLQDTQTLQSPEI